MFDHIIQNILTSGDLLLLWLGHTVRRESAQHKTISRPDVILTNRDRSCKVFREVCHKSVSCTRHSSNREHAPRQMARQTMKTCCEHHMCVMKCVVKVCRVLNQVCRKSVSYKCVVYTTQFKKGTTLEHKPLGDRRKKTQLWVFFSTSVPIG